MTRKSVDKVYKEYNMGKDIQKEMRKQMFDRIEADLQKRCKPEKRMFSLHPDEEHIIVSHALFLMMSKPLTTKLPILKGFYLLRKFEEEMLTAYLTESDEYPNCCAIATSCTICCPTNWQRLHAMQPSPPKSGNCK